MSLAKLLLKSTEKISQKLASSSGAQRLSTQKQSKVSQKGVRGSKGGRFNTKTGPQRKPQNRKPTKAQRDRVNKISKTVKKLALGAVAQGVANQFLGSDDNSADSVSEKDSNKYLKQVQDAEKASKKLDEELKDILNKQKKEGLDGSLLVKTLLARGDIETQNTIIDINQKLTPKQKTLMDKNVGSVDTQKTLMSVSTVLDGYQGYQMNSMNTSFNLHTNSGVDKVEEGLRKRSVETTQKNIKKLSETNTGIKDTLDDLLTETKKKKEPKPILNTVKGFQQGRARDVWGSVKPLQGGFGTALSNLISQGLLTFLGMAGMKQFNTIVDLQQNPDVLGFLDAVKKGDQGQAFDIMKQNWQDILLKGIGAYQGYRVAKLQLRTALNPRKALIGAIKGIGTGQKVLGTGGFYAGKGAVKGVVGAVGAIKGSTLANRAQKANAQVRNNQAWQRAGKNVKSNYEARLQKQQRTLQNAKGVKQKYNAELAIKDTQQKIRGLDKRIQKEAQKSKDTLQKSNALNQKLHDRNLRRGLKINRVSLGQRITGLGTSINTKLLKVRADTGKAFSTMYQKTQSRIAKSEAFMNSRIVTSASKTITSARNVQQKTATAVQSRVSRQGAQVGTQASKVGGLQKGAQMGTQAMQKKGKGQVIGGVQKGMQTLSGPFKGIAKMATKAQRFIPGLGQLVWQADIVYHMQDAWRHAGEYLGIPDDQLSIVHKIQAQAGGQLESLTFGLVSAGTQGKAVLKFGKFLGLGKLVKSYNTETGQDLEAYNENVQHQEEIDNLQAEINQAQGEEKERLIEQLNELRSRDTPEELTEAELLKDTQESYERAEKMFNESLEESRQNMQSTMMMLNAVSDGNRMGSQLDIPGLDQFGSNLSIISNKLGG